MARPHYKSKLALKNNVIGIENTKTNYFSFDVTANSNNMTKPFDIEIDESTLCYYRFRQATKDTIIDNSYYGNNATFTSYKYGAGICDMAAVFDGTNYIKSNAPINTNFNEFSIAICAKIQKYDASYMNLFSVINSTSTTTKICIDLYANNFRFYGHDQSGNVKGISETGIGRKFCDGKWHVFIFTFDGTTWSIYVDGELEYSKNDAMSNSYSQPSYIFVGDRNGINNKFTGKIDTVALYNRCLFSDEIKRFSNMSTYNLSDLKYEKKFIPIRYIRNWLNGNTLNTWNHWIELKAITIDGTNVAKNKISYLNDPANQSPSFVDENIDTNQWTNQNMNTEPGLNCQVVDLGSVRTDIEKIIIWHYYDDARKYHNNKTEVSADGIRWTTLYDSNINGEYIETTNGFTIYVPYSIELTGKHGRSLFVGERSYNLLANYFDDCDFENTEFENSDWKVSVVEDPGANNFKCVEIEAKTDKTAWATALTLSNRVNIIDENVPFVTEIRYKVIYCDNNASGQYAHNQLGIWSHWHDSSGASIGYTDCCFHTGTVTKETEWITKRFVHTSPIGVAYRHFHIGTGSVVAGTKFRVDYITTYRLDKTHYKSTGARNKTMVVYDSSIINKEEGTISFWINYLDIPQSPSHIFNNRSDTYANAFELLLGKVGQDTKIIFRKSHNGTTCEAVGIINSEIVNVWNHVSVTWKNNDKLYIYFNGKQIAQSSTNCNMINIGDIFVIGKYKDTYKDVHSYNNPNFYNGTDGWAISNATNGSSTIISSEEYEAEKALKVKVASGGDQYYYYTTSYPNAAGKTFAMYCTYRNYGAATTHKLSTYWSNNSGWLWSNNTRLPLNTSEITKRFVAINTAPADTQNISLIIYTDPENWTGYYEFGDIRIVEADHDVERLDCQYGNFFIDELIIDNYRRNDYEIAQLALTDYPICCDNNERLTL